MVSAPNGSVAYTYDERNRLETVLDEDFNLTTYHYDDANNLVRTEFPNGVVESREYDELNRLIGLENQVGDTVISGYRYDLNDAGHRLSVTEHEGRIVSYTYDDLYRLTEENINNGERVISYTFDNVGNRLSRTDSVEGITTYTYDDNDQLQTETLSQNGTVIDTTIYTYDDNGNLIQQVKNGTDTTTYTWNDDNRLVAVTLPDGSAVSYAYDDEGIRVSTTVDGNTTEYLIDKNRAYAQVLEEFVNDELATSYVYGHDLISQARGTDTAFYQVDGLGSTRVLTDELGSVTDTYDYDAFGNLIDSTGATENSYQFAGEQFDEALGDYYLRQRFYNQSIGRFTRRDVFEGYRTQPLTLNHYLYANANPVTYTDPSGFVSVSELSTAQKVKDILGNTFANSLRVGNKFLSTLDKVNDTVSLLQSLQQAFNLASNPTALMPTLTIGSLNKLPSFEDAANSLRANSGKIFASVVGLKIPSEAAKVSSFFREPKSTFLFFLPSTFPRKINVNTGISIQNKDMYLAGDKRENRLFGFGMQFRPGDSNRIQFFRMDYGAFKHTSGKNIDNYSIWQDGAFHYHIPKNK